jgi:protein-S-isoprenylcysteine O-methyltransferase Ste14
MADAHATVAMMAPRQFSRQTVILDACERAFVFLVFAHFAWAMLTTGGRANNFLDGLLVLAETIAVVLIVMRTRSETLSRRPSDWLLGIAGASLPLLVQPADVAPLIPAVACFCIMIFGTFLQFAAKIVLGRSFGVIAANRGVVSLGPYRLVRHPMYLGYTITHIGFLLGTPIWPVALLYATTLVVQVLRLLREEAVLMQDEAYRRYAGRVRYRLLPGVF